MFLILLVNVLVFDLKLYLKHFNMFMFHSRLSKERARNTCERSKATFRQTTALHGNTRSRPLMHWKGVTPLTQQRCQCR